MESKSRFVSVRGDVVIPGELAISKSIWKMRGAFKQNFVLRAQVVNFHVLVFLQAFVFLDANDL